LSQQFVIALLHEKGVRVERMEQILRLKRISTKEILPYNSNHL